MTDASLVILARCPFCGFHLARSSGKFNVIARCDTPGCWMHERKMTVPIDDARQMDEWNTRIEHSISAPAQAILDNLRGRRLLGYLFHDDPENVGHYGNLDHPLDLETQIDCVEDLARCVIEATEEKWELQVKRAQANGDAIAATLHERIDNQTDDIRELREALHWYATQVGCFCMAGATGDEARKLLTADIGQRARDALETNT